ncbi:unnamed protein product [Didymodactylos carnosus]|uniref:Uncharacterized protein n=1 Tax=Didymodactylos carnosus TaxID=1234261 RepID=A0A814D091_9BILA|nr:unnamed protein product [Didymodactylos carnosus]CAF0951583.1 unnamed protein product [Didymodactylos carnosus]CAF3630745.1 unnamed protein product [Didymodactylos carnosus]CAF3727223.1 unnamed protein product [Didymodactylos carnosus]
MTEKKVIAFKLGTTKRSAVLDTTRHIDKKNNHFDDATHDVEKREYIVGIDDKEVKSLVPPVEKQILIIPVQQNEHQKFFKLKQSLRERIKPKPSEKTTATITENEIEQLDVEARRLLQLDAQLANEVWNERTENGHPRVERIDVDTVNTFATLLTADGQDKHEAQKEEEVEQADYDQVSIDEFGTVKFPFDILHVC